MCVSKAWLLGVAASSRPSAQIKLSEPIGVPEDTVPRGNIGALHTKSAPGKQPHAAPVPRRMTFGGRG
ncbi:hypothetical protein E2C01_037712 [Portunus trituberculatus]|uniref:Uncharacterized protein n=1 Tax=Portunus trituberculatus TaxID=210409 RepID=A0A5B7FC66_PORTR|nr:hypothetical protein [Portunus trituberculatus]